MRPVSNLHFVSKLTERAVYGQTFDYLTTHELLRELQSAYRKRYGTETTLSKVQNDILLRMGRQQVTLLIFFDLRAAFDTVDHHVLVNRLETSSGSKGGHWLGSTLTCQTGHSVLHSVMGSLIPFIQHVGYHRVHA